MRRCQAKQFLMRRQRPIIFPEDQLPADLTLRKLKRQLLLVTIVTSSGTQKSAEEGQKCFRKDLPEGYLAQAFELKALSIDHLIIFQRAIINILPTTKEACARIACARSSGHDISS
eukprot:scaffold21713_cov177-Skeletonema_dohrnii-CCMP3373.AAC.1